MKTDDVVGRIIEITEKSVEETEGTVRQFFEWELNVIRFLRENFSDDCALQFIKLGVMDGGQLQRLTLQTTFLRHLEEKLEVA